MKPRKKKSRVLHSLKEEKKKESSTISIHMRPATSIGLRTYRPSNDPCSAD